MLHKTKERDRQTEAEAGEGLHGRHASLCLFSFLVCLCATCVPNPAHDRNTELEAVITQMTDEQADDRCSLDEAIQVRLCPCVCVCVCVWNYFCAGAVAGTV